MTKLADYITENLLASAAVATRVSNPTLKLEVEDWVRAAMADMRRVGVTDDALDEESEFYPMVRAAVLCYCKAHFGLDKPNAEQDFWDRSYRQHVVDLLNSKANERMADGVE